MKTERTRNRVVALIGLLALAGYILACTSFSPDDTKVLYPTFDAQSGVLGVAVYDRPSAKSETAFLPTVFDAENTNAPTSQLLRAQWLADGRRILVAWVGGKNDKDMLNLVLLPWGTHEPIKLFSFPGIKDAATHLLTPVCVAGERAFIQTADTELVRLDFGTGSLLRHQFADASGEMQFYPAPGDHGVFYLEERDAPAGKDRVFGRLNPDDFSRTPLFTFTNDAADGSFFTYDLEGKRLAFLAKGPNAPQLTVLTVGKSTFVRDFGAATEKLTFANAVFTRKGDALLAGFRQELESHNRGAFGLMEIPLSDAPIRQKILIPSAETEDETAGYFFQIGVSHDGKTAAVASTYVACDAKQFKPEDCALFFVDLSDPKWAVTKVPIPLPAELAPLSK